MIDEVLIRGDAKKDMRGLERPVARKLAEGIRALAREPRPVGSKKLSNHEDLYRFRIGRFRVVYQVRDRQLVVVVVAARDRKDVYRIVAARMR